MRWMPLGVVVLAALAIRTQAVNAGSLDQPSIGAGGGPAPGFGVSISNNTNQDIKFVLTRPSETLTPTIKAGASGEWACGDRCSVSVRTDAHVSSQPGSPGSRFAIRFNANGPWFEVVKQ
jgi:hypothetical protein